MVTFSQSNKLKKIGLAVLVAAGLFLVIHLVLALTPYGGLKEFLNHQYSQTYLDGDSNILQVKTVEDGIRRQWTPLEEIPDSVKAAFVFSEDRRFYIHPGVDPVSIVRAAIQNNSQGRWVSGASTITMQLVRLINPSKSKSYSNKFLEALNALRLDSRLRKDQILELYLNNVPFGNNIQGVTSAARYFYGKNLDQLTPEEILCLSVIPRRPAGYNPVDNSKNCGEAASGFYEQNKDSRKFAGHFSGLSSEGILSAAENARKHDFPFEMPHLIQSCQKVFGPDPNFGKNGKEPVRLTARLSLQNYLVKEMFQAMENSSKSRIQNSAGIVIENRTGNILAYVGNPDYFSINSGQIDGMISKKQMGSSMKPYLYASVLDRGDLLRPNSILADVPMSFGDSNAYIPGNFNNNFNGPVPLRIALASSLNVPAVYTLSQYGVWEYYRKLIDMGFESLREEGIESELGLALGGGEVTLLEMAHAWTVFANDGKLIPLNIYADAPNLAAADRTREIFKPDTARIICDILSDKSARALGFGQYQTFQTSYPSIFKTGTANQYQSIVAVGSTVDYTVAVWMGNQNGNTVIGKTGSSTPAEVARKVLDFLTDRHSGEFEKPQNWTKKKICSVSGKNAGPLCHTYFGEWIENSMLEEFERNLCDCHVEDEHGNIRTRLPAEYQNWIYNSGVGNYVIDYSSQDLTIISPKNGNIFYFDENESQYQKITVEIIGGRDADGVLEVKYDGNYLSDVFGKKMVFVRPYIFTIPLERGSHVLEATLGSEQKSVSFLIK